MKIQIQNGKVFEEKGSFLTDTLYVVNEKIATVQQYQEAEGPETVIDARGGYVIPGLTDIHFHGCMGSDCCDGMAESFQVMAEYEQQQGVTTITPATMTMSEETLTKVAEAAASWENDTGAILSGLYMEGPFVSEKKKGAQNAENIRKPDVSMFRRLQRASGGKFRTVVVAPETEGAMEFIEELSGEVRISLAHTTADYDTAKEALDRGASQLTHLFNAMMPFTHRSPGPIGAASDEENCRAELICDGIHVHPSAVRAAFRLFGDDRIIMISDSMRATGMKDGTYDLGGQTVIVKGRLAVLKDGTIAGSVTNLMDCVRTAVKEMGIPLASAVKCAAVNPAKAVGIYGEYGSLAPGKYANVVILDQDLELIRVMQKGKTVVNNG